MDKNIVKLLKTSKIGVMPTDTIYGLVGLALNEKVVESVYQIRKRSPNKPCIILISSIDNLQLFGITLNELIINYLANIWPNPVSVILPCPSEKFKYLHRGTDTLAFRLPKNPELLEILKETGPLIAPSANLEGFPYAKTIAEAKEYFTDQVDFYDDQGKLESDHSTLIKITEGKIIVLRQGKFQIDSLSKNLS